MTLARQRKAKTRAWIAMAAAYLFALQAILGGAALAQMAVAASGHGPVICSGGAADDAAPASLPARMAACSVCALAMAPADVPTPPVTAVPVRFASAARMPIAKAPETPPRHPTPRLSQGPPGIA